MTGNWTLSLGEYLFNFLEILELGLWLKRKYEVFFGEKEIICIYEPYQITLNFREF